jgi:hypothetical protein
MSMQSNVFPFELALKNGGSDINGGLTTRAYFAACAMQGLLAGDRGNARMVIKAAILHADLLIEELNKSL